LCFTCHVFSVQLLTGHNHLPYLKSVTDTAVIARDGLSIVDSVAIYLLALMLQELCCSTNDILNSWTDQFVFSFQKSFSWKKWL